MPDGAVPDGVMPDGAMPDGVARGSHLPDEGLVLESWRVPLWRKAPPWRVLAGVAGSVEVRVAEVGSAEVTALLDGLRAARAEILVRRPARDVAATLGRVGARFLRADDPLRRQALALLPGTAGISEAMARAVLDGMAADWSESRLLRLLDLDMDGGAPLDAFVPREDGGRVRALGPALAVHVVAGSVAGVGVTSLIRSLLVKSAVLLKPGLGDVALPALFLRGLEEEDAELARAAAVLYWPGGESVAEEAALAGADLVVVYGGDRSVAEVRAALPATTPLVAYHHRVSVAVVGRAAPADRLDTLVADLALAVALFDQRGCVCPHVVWVEEGGEVTPRALAAALAGALEEMEGILPPGVSGDREASHVQQLRGTEELRAASLQGVEVWHGGRALWTVVLDPVPAFEASCLNRVVRVKPVADLDELPALLAPLAHHAQSVAVAGVGERREGFAEALARLGISRVTSPRRAPWPRPWWMHDGIGGLGPLVRWTEVEPSE